MSFVSRWVEVREFTVTPGDLSAGGGVRAEAIDRWLAEARAAYLEHCVVLRDLRERSGLALRAHFDQPPASDRFGTPTSIIIGVGATEIHPRSFTMAYRVRAIDADGDTAINVTCAVSLEDPATGEARELGNDIRDELIALEHAASHIV
jgi:acyl-CoA thioesterase FadM